MTFDNPNPIVNPLNRRAYMSAGSFKRSANPSKLVVPNQDCPFFGSDEYYDFNRELTTPNQDIPLNGQVPSSGFIAGSDNLFRLSDGTIVDFKACQIIYSKKSGKYWGDPNRSLTFGYNMSWNDHTEPSIGDMLNNMENYRNHSKSTASMQLDPKSANYWLKAEEEAEKLMAGMTDKQKQMLADFEKHFPKSKLIEESRKAGN